MCVYGVKKKAGIKEIFFSWNKKKKSETNKEYQQGIFSEITEKKKNDGRSGSEKEKMLGCE